MGFLRKSAKISTNKVLKDWKESILEDKGNSYNLGIYDHHQIKKKKIQSQCKLNSKELYNKRIKLFLDFAILIIKKIFQITTLDWENIYLLPRNTNLDTNYHTFQYKIPRTTDCF